MNIEIDAMIRDLTANGKLTVEKLSTKHTRVTITADDKQRIYDIHETTGFQILLSHPGYHKKLCDNLNSLEHALHWIVIYDTNFTLMAINTFP